MNYKSWNRAPLLVLLAVTLATATTANASVIAYSLPFGTAGTQNFGGSLGMDFDVNSPIRIEQYGAFDDLSDGINGSISVAIFDRTTEAIVGPTITITTADTLNGGYRFETLGSPLDLAAGFQGAIVAWGYNSDEFNGNSGGTSGFPPPTLDDGGGLISFVGQSRWGSVPGAYPDHGGAGPVNRFGAGSFDFSVPEPATFVIWSVFGGIGLVVGRWRMAS